VLLLGNTYENVTGGSGNDTLTGNALGNVLRGGPGNDTYVFDADAALGTDTLDESGGGSDTLDFGATAQNVSVNLATATTQTVNAMLSLILLAGDTFEDVIGGSGSDRLTGNALDNRLEGGPGDDTYVFDADEPLGSDTLDESGGGTDTLDFSATAQNVSVNLSMPTAQDVNANLVLALSAGDTFEKVIAGSGNDFLTGNSRDNGLTGGLGDDTYFFDAATALGTDTLDESGGGTDTLDFSLTTTRSVSINLSLAGQQSVNAGNLDLILSAANTFEKVIGGSLNDRITGNSLANRLTGGPGNDSLTGGALNDTYVFDADVALGNDTLTELVSGGTDTLDFGATTQNVSINLGLTGLQSVNGNLMVALSAVNTFENVIGGSGNDTINGNTLANRLEGRGGDDMLVGTLGDDTFVFDTDGQLDTDTLFDSSGVDTFDFSLTTTQAITVNLSTVSPTIQQVNANLRLKLTSATAFENVIGGSMNDTITGNALNNRLEGGAGDDTYVFDTDGKLGSDIVRESGGGADTLDFSLTTTRIITINLATTTLQAVNLNLNLTLQAGSTIENVFGGSGNDSITGNALDNRLEGGPGNDTLVGNDGDDIFSGGAGSDNAQGGLDCDTADATTEVVNLGGQACDGSPSTGQVLDGYVSAATVFLDANQNGILDFQDIDNDGIRDADEQTEPSTVTRADGSYSLMVIAAFDLNGNGRYDPAEGTLVVTGGIDIATTLPLLSPMMVPAGTDRAMLTPLSTLITMLVQRNGLSIEEA
jgi:Ca2+-binding RTX toxin-like protein